MDHRNAPQIVPGNASVGGANVQVVADAIPDQFPHGLEILVMKPGQLEPLGRIPVPRGCMVGIVPEQLAGVLRGAVMRQMATNAPGLRH